MLRFDKAIYSSFLLKFILSVRLSNNLSGSDVLLFLEFKNIAFIFYYTFIEFIIFFYTLLAVSFAQHKKYKICLISFSNFSNVLPTFTWERAISNL